ncbi:MAG TPA: hypothetical protein VGF81_16280 [Solirubrobacteraceae bacterium]
MQDEWDHEAELARIQELWTAEPAQLGLQDAKGRKQRHYLKKHLGFEPQVRRRLRALDRMTPFVRGRVLEWGCRHALDSAVLTMRLGSAIECHGADLFPPGLFAPFHEFSGLLIDALPNRYSYTEAWLRLTGGPAHKRRYSAREIDAALERHGFDVLQVRRVGVLPGCSPRCARSAAGRSGHERGLAAPGLRKGVGVARPRSDARRPATSRRGVGGSGGRGRRVLLVPRRRGLRDQQQRPEQEADAA